MEKIKRWHIITLLIVFALTLYNVLPTVIYYKKPLSQKITDKEAASISKEIISRWSSIEKDNLKWLQAYVKHLKFKTTSIEKDPVHSNRLHVEFEKSEDALKFKQLLPYATSQIDFEPARLQLDPCESSHPKKVTLLQNLSTASGQTPTLSFVPNMDKSEDLKTHLQERAKSLAYLVAQSTDNSDLEYLLANPELGEHLNHQILQICENVQAYQKNLGPDSDVTHHFLSYLVNTQDEAPSQLLVKAIDQSLKQPSLKEQEVQSLKVTKAYLEKKSDYVDQRAQKTTPSTFEFTQDSNYLDLQKAHPIIQGIKLDWELNEFQFVLTKQAEKVLKNHQNDLIHNHFINQFAYLAKISNEKIVPTSNGYTISFYDVPDSSGYLQFSLDQLAQSELQGVRESLSRLEKQAQDLQAEVFPVSSYDDYLKLESVDKKFGMVLYAPVCDSNRYEKKANPHSLYILVRGLTDLFEKYNNTSEQESKSFISDVQKLQSALQQLGFYNSYIATGDMFGPDFKGALVFEKPHYYQAFLKASRENFKVRADARVATLELQDIGERIHTVNKLETQIHEELVKWKEDYQAAQVDLVNPAQALLVPPPTKNIYWDNFKLSFKKYLRGDARKVIKWGLDLSGGQSLTVGLKDAEGSWITDRSDLQQGLNELTKRVNKMGLAEVDIRLAGNHITLDFPSAKGLSPQELVKGSTMTFHVVNEALSSRSSPYFEASQTFLQGVYNEAYLKDQLDAKSLNEIAWKHLGGQPDGSMNSESNLAKQLFDAGLVFNPPSKQLAEDSPACKVALYASEKMEEWRGQSHPLVWVYANPALEGNQIENIRTSYDPKEGNLLAFEVKSSHLLSNGKKINPRDQFYQWTSKYAKDQIAQTPLEKMTPGRGWRLAIVLNNKVINDPQLNQALSANVQVSGGFTQQEVNRLASDLKAGSLSYKPEILSTQNVSADLGQQERLQGIWATVIALSLVIVIMVAYYRFSGLVASIAVLFNLLIMWAILQNLQATLTLSGLAGIILTLGMAVDANVLVFERIREELKQSKKLSTAIYTGYRQAFSAIFDSNFTTVLAAFILLNFDTGPIKGLAITLTIGITSSMFTALFMTQVFFMKWAEKTHKTSLNMANWFQSKTRNFLKHARPITFVSMGLIVMGMTLLTLQSKSILGMDFTGGYSLNLQFKPSQTHNLRNEVTSALIQAGAKSSEVQIRELESNHHLRVQLSSSLEEKGRPFYTLEAQSLSGTNPRIDWIVQALQSANLPLDEASLNQLGSQWTEMSGQLSKTTKNNAILALGLALVGIMLYLSIRFEFKFALSALLCTLHDVLACLSLIGLLHLVGVPIQLNMQVIAALMTLIGYSLNDTIIVFDRIREEKKILRNSSMAHIINHSLSATLNRTLMTSITTFSVVFALMLLGGSKIFDFAVVMSAGVIIGTLSSLFIAPCFLTYLHGQESSYANKRSSSKTVALFPE